MQLLLALLVGKLVILAMRVSGHGGSALPGLWATRIEPRLIGRLSRRFERGVIVITGTNGKTTTTKLLVEILQGAGHSVVTNQTGSNLSRGVASALIAAAGPFGGIKADWGVFEVDEASLPDVVAQTQPQHIVVLNLFRDQLDRYGEVHAIALVIREALAGAPDAVLHLNADDPLVASLGARAASSAPARYFGVDDPSSARTVSDDIADSSACPLCDEPLEYERSYFAHLGTYRCRNGHFERPPLDAALVRRTTHADSTTLDVELRGRPLSVTVRLAGLYNSYNVLAALLVADALDIDDAAIVPALDRADVAFGRGEVFTVDGRHVTVVLVKNPAGCAQVLQTFVVERPSAPVMIAINDNDADGRDISWLWDVPFEVLGPDRAVVASGSRATDMAVRLKYAEVPTAAVVEDLGGAVEQLVARTPAGEVAYVLPSYTAMLAVRTVLQRAATPVEVPR